MKYCPRGHNFTGHTIGLQNYVLRNGIQFLLH